MLYLLGKTVDAHGGITWAEKTTGPHFVVSSLNERALPAELYTEQKGANYGKSRFLPDGS